MADRMFHSEKGALEIDRVELFAEITFGAAGAVDSFTAKGTSNIALEGTSTYKISLEDSYYKLLAADTIWLEADALDPASVGNAVKIESEDVNSSSDPHLKITTTKSSDGTDTIPADGSKLYVTIKLRNSSVD